MSSTISYENFCTKYDQFVDLDEDKFVAFLADATAEIDRQAWGQLRSRALEMLLGHYLSLAMNDRSSKSLQSFQVDDKGYSVNYQQQRSPTGYEATWFGEEYKRLMGLNMSTNINAATISHFHGVRNNPFPQRW